MRRGKEYFNSAIYRKDMLRFWPVWALELAVMLLGYIFPLLSEVNAATAYGTEGDLGWSLMEEMQYILDEWFDRLTNPNPVALFCIVVTVFLFSYLTKEREAYMIHSFPVNRDALFASHYLAGFTMLTAPYAVAYLMVMLVAAVNGAGWAVPLLVGYFAETVIEIFLFYHLACLTVMLTGNGLMAVVIYVVLNFLYAGVWYLYYGLQELFVYGLGFTDFLNDGFIEGMLGQALTPIFTLGMLTGYIESSQSGWSWEAFGTVACYLIPAAIFLVLAVVLYRKRPVESAGDMVAFSWGRPIFRTVFSVCGGILFALLMYLLCFNYIDYYRYNTIFIILLVLVLAGVALCYLISEMILYRTFRIWKKISWVQMAILLVVVCISLFYIKTGPGRYIPKADKVKMVCVEAGLLEEELWFDEWYSGASQFYFYEKEEIEAFQKLERDILKEGPKMESQGDCSDFIENITVTYYLKDGRKITKSYPLLTEEYPGDGAGTGLYGKVSQFLSTAPNIERCLFGLNYENPDISQVTLYPVGEEVLWEEEEDEEDISQEVLLPEKDEREIAKVYGAVLEDLKAGRYFSEKESEDVLGEIAFQLDSGTFAAKQSAEDQVSEELRNMEFAGDISVHLIVNKRCSATIAALKEVGMAEVLGID